MPNDVYRWEDGGGLVHHCPVCQTPLSHERCRTKCLGVHVEWCSRYHTQLFRKGLSRECAPCGHGEDQHDERHRAIASLLHQLKGLQDVQAPQSPKSLYTRYENTSTPSPLSKKDRKSAKKAAKIAEMPRVITSADVEFVANILHPCATNSNAAEEEEKRLLDDPDIVLNLYFHKGTSNTREVRFRHLKHKQADGNVDIDIEATDLDAVMAALKVPTLAAVRTEPERRLIKTLREVVKDDLVRMQKEHEQTAMRKAGFWRWASRKAYDRLMANGRIWEDKGTASEVKRKDSVFSDVSNDNVEEESTTAEDTCTPDGLAADGLAADGLAADGLAADGLAATAAGLGSGDKLSHRTNTPDTPTSSQQNLGNGKGGSAEDEWTTIGKAKPIKKLVGKLKLVRNGGLDKFELKRGGKFGALSSFDRDAVDA